MSAESTIRTDEQFMGDMRDIFHQDQHEAAQQQSGEQFASQMREVFNQDQRDAEQQELQGVELQTVPEEFKVPVPERTVQTLGALALEALDPSPGATNEIIDRTAIRDAIAEEHLRQMSEEETMRQHMLEEIRKMSAIGKIAQYNATQGLSEGFPGPTARGFYGLN